MNIDLKLKQSLMDETDSKMNMISVYVDQLEERLASFAMARRDIEAREERCKGLEQKSGENIKEIENLRSQLELVAKERDEVKNLVELLVRERTALEKKKMKLEEEIKVHTIEGESMRVQIHQLNGELNDMKQQVSTLTMKVGELESLKNLSDMELHSLHNLRGNYEAALEQAKRMDSEVNLLRDEKDEILRRISSLEVSKSNVEDQLAERLTEISYYKNELEILNEKLADIDPQSPIALLWDQASAVLVESKSIRSRQDRFKAFNTPAIQSLALALYNTKMQLPDHIDMNELIQSMCTQEIRKLLSNETTTSFLKEGLITHLHKYSGDVPLPSFVFDQSSIKCLAMLVLTKMVVNMIPVGGNLQYFTADYHLDELPPPPPPIPEEFIGDTDMDIPDVGDIISESAMELQGSRSSQSPTDTVQASADGENMDQTSFSYLDTENFDPSSEYLLESTLVSEAHYNDEEINEVTDGENMDRMSFSTSETGNFEPSSYKLDYRSLFESNVVSETQFNDEEINEVLVDETSSLDRETVEAGSGDSDLVGNDMADPFQDDHGILKSGTSSITISRGNIDEPALPVHRKVPFRSIRKFLSRKTGLHGLITPQSTGRNATTQLKIKMP